jgi:hypothetical protein
MLLAAALAACGTNGIQLPQPDAGFSGTQERPDRPGGHRQQHLHHDQAGSNLRAITECQRGELLYDMPTWAWRQPVGVHRHQHPPEGGAEAPSLCGRRGTPSQIYRSEVYLPFYLYWSPDGQWLSFLTSPGSSQIPLALQMASAEGGQVSLLDTGRPFYWAWSPRERKLLVHAGGSARSNPETARLAFLDVLEPVVKPGERPARQFSAPAFRRTAHLLPAGENAAGVRLMLTDVGELEASLAEFRERSPSAGAYRRLCGLHPEPQRRRSGDRGPVW